METLFSQVQIKETVELLKWTQESRTTLQERFDPNQAHQRRDRYSKYGDSKHIEGFKCPARKFQCKTCSKYGHFTSLCYKKKVSFKSRTPRHISCKWEWSTHEKIPYLASQVILSPVMNHSVFKWRYNADKLIPRFPHLIILLPILLIDWSHTTKEISTWEPD